MSNIKANDPKWIGYRQNKLTVTGIVFKNKRYLWECQCDCGNTTIVYPQQMITGRQKACRCGKSVTFHEMHYKHGGAGTRLYEIWCSMKKRCNNPHAKNYARYGGRGITVCSEWEQFEPFQDWALSVGYAEALTLERKDVNGNYCPENCTWIPQKRQARNRTSNKNIQINGETHTLVEWCEIRKLNYSTVYSRIRRGATPEVALEM